MVLSKTPNSKLKELYSRLLCKTLCSLSSLLGHNLLIYIALNDVNIRVGNIIKLSQDKLVLLKNCSILADKREMSPKTIDMQFIHVKCLFYRIQHAFLPLLKCFFTILSKYIQCI